MKKIWLLFLPIMLFATKGNNDDFMSNLEYGHMLYNNPRGISCSKCHGEQGEGKFIGQFFSIKQEKKSKKVVVNEIQGSRINNKTLQEIKKSVLCTKHDVMPTYSLTDKEIQAIFDYLQHQRYR